MTKRKTATDKLLIMAEDWETTNSPRWEMIMSETGEECDARERQEVEECLAQYPVEDLSKGPDPVMILRSRQIKERLTKERGGPESDYNRHIVGIVNSFPPISEETAQEIATILRNGTKGR